MGSITVITSSIVVTNTGNIDETFEFNATTITVGSPWKINPTQATDRFVLWALINPTQPLVTDFGSEDILSDSNLRCTSTAITNGANTCVAVPVGQTRTLWFKLGMPTLTNTGASQQIKVLGTATAPD